MILRENTDQDASDLGHIWMQYSGSFAGEQAEQVLWGLILATMTGVFSKLRPQSQVVFCSADSWAYIISAWDQVLMIVTCGVKFIYMLSPVN